MTREQKVGRARTLRREQTDAERVLWKHLRGRQLEGCKFRRQVPIGRYIADFVCLDARLIVEVDGGQHAEQAAYDAERTQVLKAHGYQVIRFWNTDVLRNAEGAVEMIRSMLSPSLLSSHAPSGAIAAPGSERP